MSLLSKLVIQVPDLISTIYARNSKGKAADSRLGTQDRLSTIHFPEQTFIFGSNLFMAEIYQAENWFNSEAERVNIAPFL